MYFCIFSCDCYFFYYTRLYFTYFLLARSNTRDILFSNILISKNQFMCNKKSYCTLVQNQWIKLLSPSQLVTSIQYTKKLNIFKKFQNFKIFKNFIILKISKISKISRILCYFNLCYTHSCYYCFWCIRTSENNDLINIWALPNLHRVLL